MSAKTYKTIFLTRNPELAMEVEDILIDGGIDFVEESSRMTMVHTDHESPDIMVKVQASDYARARRLVPENLAVA